MPNHIINNIVIEGDNIEEVVKSLSGENNFDFNKIIPMPDDIKNPKDSYDDRWYDWSIDHWGTKWNSYDNAPWLFKDHAASTMFFTAWDPPYKALLALSKKFPDITISDEWADEFPDPDGIGTYTFKNGKCEITGQDLSDNEVIEEWCRIQYDSTPEDEGYIKDKNGNWIYLEE